MHFSQINNDPIIGLDVYEYRIFDNLLKKSTKIETEKLKRGYVKISITELSKITELERHTISEKLKSLKNKGLIMIYKKNIEILDFDKYIVPANSKVKTKSNKPKSQFQDEEKEEQLVHNAVKEFHKKEEQNKEPVAPSEVESDIDVSLDEENRLEEGLDAIDCIFEELEEPKKTKFEWTDTKRSKADDFFAKLRAGETVVYKPLVYSKVESVKTRKYGEK